MAGNWTPGPWWADDLSVTASADDDRMVADCDMFCPPRNGFPERTDEQNLANARLIAAAPDLYAALSDLLQYIDDHDWGLIPEGVTGDRARAALSKARGDQPDSDPPIPNSATPQGA